MDGYIKMHRKILENPIVCKDSDYFAIWGYLLLNATHKEYQSIFKGEKITLAPGQLLTGRKSISEKFTINESKVQRVLKKLEIEQQIEQQTSNENRLITILRWDDYQTGEQQIEQRVNNKRTTSEQRVNTNKNVKNDKNVKKKDNKQFSENENLNNALLEFIDYRKTTKKPMTDHAVSLLITKLNKMNSDINIQIAILNQSIMMGWQGVFELKNEDKTQFKPLNSKIHNFPERNYTKEDYSNMEQRLLNK